MSLSILFKALEHDLTRTLPRNTRSFLEARARNPELAPFPTVSALLAALSPSSSASPLALAARRSLIAVLVAEAQAHAPSFASGVLVLTFAPMLHRLRRRITSRRDDEDLDSNIALAFTGAIDTVEPGPYASLALRWATERAVLTARKAERRHARHVSFNERFHSQPPVARDHARSAIEDARRSLAKKGMAHLLDILLATQDQEESLRDFVARQYASAHERRTRYAELCRARQHLKHALRKRLLGAGRAPASFLSSPASSP